MSQRHALVACLVVAAAACTSTATVPSTTTTVTTPPTPPTATTRDDPTTTAPEPTTAPPTESSRPPAILFEVEVGAPAYPRLVAVDLTGTPTLVYVTSLPTGNGVSILRCVEIDCSSVPASREILPATPDVSGDVSAVLAGDGSPVFAAFVEIEPARGEDSPGTYGTRVVACGDPACEASSTWTTPGTPAYLGTTGGDLVMAVGMPESGWSLEHWRCRDTDCSDPVRSAIGRRGPGMYGEATFGAGGRPLVTYQGEGAIHLVTCPASGCTGAAETIEFLREPPPLGYFTAPVLDGRNRPAVVAVDGDVVTLLRCLDPDCASSTETTLGGGADGGARPAVAAADDELIVAWTADGSVTVAHCDGDTCSPATAVVGTDGAAGSVAMALNGDGLPIIAYTLGDPPTTVALVECGSFDCGAG